MIVGDVNPVRLAHAKSVGFEIADLSTDVTLADQIAHILGVPEVDSAIDAVGFEARGHGHEGAQAAGGVVQAFGSFVVGNNYVIGFIVFVILVVINFIVITKGSGRVAEVAARFTLDAMPGKQMSIDAELNAGIINEAEAKKRRKEIEQEADFYGAMDGASKFVRGDAIAGIIITIVNIVGGLLIGILQKDLDLATAAKNYTMLTIGDGLLAQIPALIISTAAGTIVTRSSSGENMGTEITSQLFANSRAIYISGGVLGALALIPGLPTVPFLTMGLILAAFAVLLSSFSNSACSFAISASFFAFVDFNFSRATFLSLIAAASSFLLLPQDAIKTIAKRAIEICVIFFICI